MAQDISVCAGRVGSGPSPVKRAPGIVAVRGAGHKQGMKPRISVFTLGVADLGRAVAFYRDGLGLPTEGVVGREFEHGAVAFFDLAGGVKLALWAQADVAHDTGLAPTPPSPTAFTIGHNVSRPEEVDEVIAQARTAGAEILKTPKETFWGGYAGYFRDLDGHVWEVVWNPALSPPAD